MSYKTRNRITCNKCRSFVGYWKKKGKKWMLHDFQTHMPHRCVKNSITYIPNMVYGGYSTK